MTHKPHTITEEILKESTDRILLALKHKGIDVKRPDFIIEHEVRKELQSSIDVPDTENIGSNTTWNEFVKKAISQTLQRQREEIVKSLRMENMRWCPRCKRDSERNGFTLHSDCPHPELMYRNQAIDEFNKKVDELLK